MKQLLGLSDDFLRSLNILDWGYTENSIPNSISQYEKWIKEGLHAPLGYLGDFRSDLRSDLRKVYPDFQSSLVFLFSYQETKKWMMENNHHEVAAYSLGFEGQDYHHVLKERLDRVFLQLKNQFPNLEKFIALDAQPVMERDLAYRAGLGWFGKNSMLIHQKEGSYFIIGSLLLNQKLPLPKPVLDTDHCGQCNACVEACPTKAIDGEMRTLIANKCISTFTIEVFKEATAPEGFEKSRGEVFGCDICQDVCPWNRKPLARVNGFLKLQESYSFLKEWFYELPKVQLMELFEKESNRGVKKILFGTPFDRPGKQGWIKNIKAWLSTSKQNKI
jgi:epoxyqueuosine reductase